METGTRLGPYEILAPLGAGGMGEVYRARDSRLARDVAVKVLPEEFFESEERRQRFEREARLLASLNHPNIAAVFSFEEAEGRHLLVMELLEGETLRERLGSGALPVHNAVEIGIGIVRGLAAAHAKGIVHRDLKPANIFVTRDGVVKLLDFGLAKLTRPEAAVRADETTVAPEPQTERGTVLGTMGYMSPEQLRGEIADARSDLFAFGCVLFEMLSGKSPFLKATGAETITSIMSEDPPPLSGTGRAVAPALTEIVKRCLEKRPDERFSSAHDLALALRAFSGGSEIPATAAVVPAKRPRRGLGSIGIVAALIVVAAIGGWKLLSRPKGTQPTSAAKQPLRIVVLPFENLGSSDDAYFASGMTEEITSRLANVRTLAVISRTSSTQYDRKGKTIEQVGKDFGVGYVLEGSVRWDRTGGGPGRVRITPQLIRVADDTHLWSERYDRQLADIFAIQGDVADGVVRALNLTLAPIELTALRQLPTKDLEAYDFYLRALEMEKRGLGPSACDQMRKFAGLAVDRDPQFAEALALLARARILRYWLDFDRSDSELERSKIEAERAVALRPGAAETHRALGYYHYQVRRDYEAALAEFRKALAIQPNDALTLIAVGFVRRRQGRMDESEAVFQKALERDPRNGTLLLSLGETRILMRKYPEAIRDLELSTTLNPSHTGNYSLRERAYLLWHGDVGAAEAVLRKALDVPNVEDPIGTLHLRWVRLALIARNWEEALRRLDKPWNDASMKLHLTWLTRAEVLSRVGRREAASEAFESARRILVERIEKRPADADLHSNLGIALAGLGRTAEAVQEGERGVALLPLSIDAFWGSHRVEALARIHAMVGNEDAAIQRLGVLLSRPSFLSVPLLRIDPCWDPLRKNPKFVALLAKYEVKP